MTTLRTFSFLLLLFCTNSWGSTILVLGDSLSAGYGIDIKQGWVNLMQQELEGSYTLVNGSISGDTTGGGLARLPTLLEQYNPDLVLIALGGNDGLSGHPLKGMRSNLQKMIALCRQHGSKPILFAIQIPPNYGKRYTEAFNGIYTDVAESANVPLIPFLFEELLTTEGMIQDDGIHPTEKAQPLISREFLLQLTPLLEGLREG